MQGFNMGRYYPPDATNPPTFNKPKSKSAASHPTIRFELPYAVWCQTCKPEGIVGQGVRFNAQKRQVGKYHSTPIWAFRMKHPACGGWWEIRTDPARTAYVCFEGVRRRDGGDVAEDGQGGQGEGEMRFLSTEERERRRDDAFAGFEGRVADRVVERKAGERVEELYEMSEVWRDPYDVNARLRRGFRKERKVVAREERKKEGLRNKFGLGLEIVDETEGDRARAGMVEFGAGDEDKGVRHRPLFAAAEESTAVVPAAKSGKLKAQVVAEQSRKNLQQTLVDNTRATLDPFLAAREGAAGSRLQLGILKRKRDDPRDEPVLAPAPAATAKGPDPEANNDGSGSKAALSSALVDYDSDSDGPD